MALAVTLAQYFDGSDNYSPGSKLVEQFRHKKRDRRDHDRRAEGQATEGAEQAKAHVTGNPPDAEPV